MRNILHEMDVPSPMTYYPKQGISRFKFTATLRRKFGPLQVFRKTGCVFSILSIKSGIS